MKIWLDAQLPPALADWLTMTFSVEASALKELTLRDAQDIQIFEAAKLAKAIVVTKDSDFVDLVCRLGPPPQILWLTCGNVTNRNLKRLLTATLPKALDQLQQGEAVVEISSADI